MMTLVLLPGPCQEAWQEYSVLLGLSAGLQWCCSRRAEDPHPEDSWRAEGGVAGEQWSQGRGMWGERM